MLMWYFRINSCGYNVNFINLAAKVCVCDLEAYNTMYLFAVYILGNIASEHICICNENLFKFFNFAQKNSFKHQFMFKLFCVN